MSWFFETWESLAHFPGVWKFMPQVMIPKPGLPREQDKAKPVSALRPIVLMSVWWRVYICARLNGREKRSWLDSKLLPSQSGGRRGRDSQSIFCELAEGYALLAPWTPPNVLTMCDLSWLVAPWFGRAFLATWLMLSKICGKGSAASYVGTRWWVRKFRPCARASHREIHCRLES